MRVSRNKFILNKQNILMHDETTVINDTHTTTFRNNVENICCIQKNEDFKLIPYFPAAINDIYI